MGMKPRPKSRDWYGRQIRKVNRQLKHIAEGDPHWHFLVDRKDRLIDELVAACGHGSLIESPPEDGSGMMSRYPVRACILCGEAEYTDGDWLILTGPAKTVDRCTFTIRLGLVLKDLGVNL